MARRQQTKREGKIISFPFLLILIKHFFILNKKIMLLSLDISTTCVGYSVFNENGVLIELNYVKFNSKDSYFERLNHFKRSVDHLLQFNVKHIAIEEPLEKFKGKFSSAHTIAVLNFFNGMVSGFLYNYFKIEPVYYNVNNARSLVLPGMKIKKDGASTKHQIWEKVVEMEPQVNWKYGLKSRKLMEENYDMVDAYIVGRNHFKMMEVQREKALGK